MNCIFLFYLPILCACCCGFLVDDRTPPTTKRVDTMSEEHFTTLLSFLAEEKNSRLQLEKRVNQLQSELLTTQQGVTQVYHAEQKQNETIGLQSASFKDLERKYNELQRKYDNLQNDRCRTNQSSCQFVNLTETFKGLPDLKQIVMDLSNETKHIAGNLEKVKQSFEAKYHELEAKQRNMFRELELLSAAENKTEVTLQKHVNEVSTRVALEVCAFGKNYSTWDKILFPYVYTMSGSIGTAASSLKSNGMFVCQQPGLYLISIFILTLYQGDRVDIIKGPSYVCLASVYFRKVEQISATVLT